MRTFTRAAAPTEVAAYDFGRQRVVADIAAERLVERLEAVEVDDEQAERARRRRREERVQALLEAAAEPVGEAA